MYRAATLHAMKERSVLDGNVNEVTLKAGLDRMFGVSVQPQRQNRVKFT